MAMAKRVIPFDSNILKTGLYSVKISKQREEEIRLNSTM